MKQQSGCLVCGKEIIYREQTLQACSFCGKEAVSQAACAAGHYVCDTCHSGDPLGFLEGYVAASAGTDPIGMLEEVMRHPSFAMHGPEHHFLIPAIFLTALKNSGTTVPANFWQLVLSRGSQLPGGTCGLWGACAASVGCGITLSILKSCTPLKKEFYDTLHAANSNALAAVAEVGGPRCCKRNTLLSAYALIDFLDSGLGITFPSRSRFTCSFMHRNTECLGRQCPFFPGGTHGISDTAAV